ncbi:hypothetical protein [Verrucomicrobium spinosum]|uniref:hypothetical protein n=1 Tax=Verrucomicrobium spinosum TaxID=2736 RepID=UPI0012E2BB03|nr:hypothetical protein [Verrucomicrobium spinosum]
MSETATSSNPQSSVMMKDFMSLTKFRLSVLVLVTTFVGYWLGRSGKDLDLALMFHTLLGSALAAFGAAVFNQLMEIEPDSAWSAPLIARFLPGAWSRVWPLGWVGCSVPLRCCTWGKW